MRFGVLAATFWEMKPWLKASSSHRVSLKGEFPFFSGRCQSVEVVTCLCGMGMGHAERAARVMIERYQPCLILNAGFAGALDPGMKLGDWVVDASLPGLNRAVSALAAYSVKRTPVASVSSVLLTPQDKRLFQSRTGASVADMEWERIKGASQKASLPHAALKVISDTADETIYVPRGLRHHSGPLTMKKVLWEMMKDPFCVFHMIPAANRTARLSRELSDFMNEFIPLAASVMKASANETVKTC